MGIGVKGRAVAAGLALAIFATAFEAARAADEAPPDLGVVGVGEAAAHVFTVRNGGDRPLTLSVRRVARGLRLVSYDLAVPPGAGGKVHVEVDTLAVLGPVTLGLVVGTDDPARPEVVLALRVEVRPFVVAWPGQARYLFVQRIRDGVIAQTVWATDGADFRIDGLESPHPFVRTAVREARPEERRPDASGRQWRVELTLPADAPVGPLGGALVVRVDHPRQKTLRVPVSGFVRPLFAVTPPVARLGPVEAGVPARLSLHVKSFAEEPVSLLGATADVPGVSAELTPIERGRAYQLRLTLEAGAPAGELTGTLRIRTDSPRQPVIEVPFSGTVRPAAGAPVPGGGGG